MENQEIKYDERLISLLEQALHLQVNERDEFLRRECAGDALLYEDLQNELQWDQRMGRFLLDPLLACIDIEDPFKPGDLIDDRFLIVRCVGEGGMGLVYEAVDKLVDERRALKCAKPGFEPRLPSEARAAVRISHDNVCRVCEIHSTKTRHGTLEFLSMEFVQGHILSEYIKEKGRLNPAETDSVLRQLCKGLGAAHQQGLLHRDLKSNNIMLTKYRDGSLRAVIMDFGLATASGAAMESSSTLRGALPYIAPEVSQGGKATVASDIYSLGVIAYEMVTGQLPKDILSRSHAAKSSLPSNKLIRSVRSHLDKIILKCMDPDPTRRLSSCGEILHQLDRLSTLTVRSMRMFRAKAGSYMLVSVVPFAVSISVIILVGRLAVSMAYQNSPRPSPIEQWALMGWETKVGFLLLIYLSRLLPHFVSECAACHLAFDQYASGFTRLRDIFAEMPGLIPAGVTWSLLVGLLPVLLSSIDPLLGFIAGSLMLTLLGLTIPIIVLEERNLFGAVQRSVRLVRRILGRVFLLSSATWVGWYTAPTLLGMLVYLMPPPDNSLIWILIALAFVGVGVAWSSFLGIVFTLFYFEALEKLGNDAGSPDPEGY
jgi:hypothetical protein